MAVRDWNGDCSKRSEIRISAKFLIAPPRLHVDAVAHQRIWEGVSRTRAY